MDPYLAEQFERHRRLAFDVGYRVTGSVADAEDAVQEAWLRLAGARPERIENLAAWLTVTVARIGLDMLTSARARRERYVGTWLPEPLLEGGGPGRDPAKSVSMDESISYALLVVLEEMTPAERVAFVLHDCFGVPFGEIAELVGRSPATVRQLAARGRRRARTGQGRFDPDEDTRRRTVAAFAAACASGDLAALAQVLDPQVMLRVDGGGVIPGAALRAVRGSDAVARWLLGVSARDAGKATLTPLRVNGDPGLLLRRHGLTAVLAISVRSARVAVIDIVASPAKLASLPD